jgi:hypothetical protein
MNIGDPITFVEDGENKIGTVSWIAPEYVFVKVQSGEIIKVIYENIKSS